MSAAPVSNSIDPAVAATRAARHGAALDALVEMGMDLARIVHRRAQALEKNSERVAEPGVPETDGVRALSDVTAAFDRVARVVRRTVSLARVLDTPPRAEAGPSRATARARVLRRVEDRIHETVSDRERAEGLRTELYERVDAPEFDDLLDGQTVEDVILDIQRDLGIGSPAGCRPPWPRRSPDAAAALIARTRGAAAVGSAMKDEVPWIGDGQETDCDLALRLVGAARGRGPP